MFLSILNKKEKENFLNLLINTASIDGDFSENEKLQINAYVLEMGLELKDNAEYKSSNDDLIQSFKTSSESVKRAIFMELTALMLADGLHEKEDKLLDKILREFDIEANFKDEAIKWYEEISPLYIKGFELIGAIK